MKDKILVSTDIGSDIDDAIALLIMLNHPEINLGGIYTVNGLVNFRCYIAKRMIDLAKSEIPIGCGTSKPLFSETAPYSFFEECLVDDIYIDEKEMEMKGKIELMYKPLKKVGIIPRGLKHFADQLLKEKCIVFSIGPMTDIALLLERYPKSVKNIKRLFIMGFKLNGGQEHNVRFDSLAAQNILRSTIPITIIPSDLCKKYRMSTNIIRQMVSPAGKYVASMLKAFIGAKTINKCRQPGILPNNFQDIQYNWDLLNKLGPEKHLKIIEFSKCFFSNFDEYTAYFERENFLKNLVKVTSYMGDVRLAEKIRSSIVKDISVADAFTPYCYLYPEKLNCKRTTIECDFLGNSYTIDGNKHEVVIDLDFEHFQEYLYRYLH